jgi:hypothetical protein
LTGAPPPLDSASGIPVRPKRSGRWRGQREVGLEARVEMAARLGSTSRRIEGGGDASSRDSRASFEFWIRQAFFSHGAWLANRYGLTPEDLIAQAESSPMPPVLGVPRRPEGIEDLLVVAGCCRNHPQAWIDAAEILEPLLVRASRMRLGESDALVFARRFWTSLRERTSQRASGSPASESPAMQDYPPNRPLRNWLIDRLSGSIESAMRTERLPNGRRVSVVATEGRRRRLQLADSGT